MNGEQLSLRFFALTALLQSQQQWWRPRAFFEKRLPWENENHALAQRLRKMPLDESERLAADDRALQDFLRDWVPAAADIAHLCALPEAPAIAPMRSEPVDVPGRKWQQIRAFVANLATTELPAVEWCAGKGHLGRWYARNTSAAVDALEWNAGLVEAGNRLSQQAGLPVRLHHVDVLNEKSKNYLHADRQILALHACGQLHVHLLQLCASENPAQKIALAPCCYHLIPHDRYQPLSAAARAANLPLSKIDLRTAVQESMTSPERVQKQRRQLQVWRLAFDLLQRDLRGVDTYLPTPPRPLSVLRAGFKSYCEKMAAHINIELPPTVDHTHYEDLGAQRFIEVIALDLPRMLFRRALELWLVLDRALLLQENDYDVEIVEFCERALTPRNILIRAGRP